MNKFIVEYVTNVAADEKELVPREVKHPALLASRDIKRCDDGVLIVNDFFEGKTLREVQSDIFSFSVLLYELLTGERPFGLKNYWLKKTNAVQ